jgi:hypothetical protein
MFLFLQFILDNVRPYADVHALCLTSTESVEFMTRYYRCTKPMVLPFPCYRLKQKGASAWDKFTNYFLSKSVFREPSEHRMRLCILLDFMKASQHTFTIIPNPRDLILEFYGFFFCRRMIKSHHKTWFATLNARSDPPFCFFIGSMDHLSDELYGIVFTEMEYMTQFNRYFHEDTDTIYDSWDIHFSKAHVVKSLGRTYVIVLMCDYSLCDVSYDHVGRRIQARSDFYIADGADVHERTSTDIEAFASRFHIK